jgi:hypothetical protein
MQNRGMQRTKSCPYMSVGNLKHALASNKQFQRTAWILPQNFQFSSVQFLPFRGEFHLAARPTLTFSVMSFGKIETHYLLTLA